jgi:hypothetical protein
VGWLAVSTARIYPHHGSYFNETAGPWTNWSNIVVDSNLDWGQDLPALRAVMDELAIEEVNLAYFGKGVPEAYGVRYRPLPGFLRFVEGTELNAYNPLQPAPGWYAISATSLQLGLQQPESADLYAYFRDLTPAARAGYSIYLYQVQEADDAAVTRRVLRDSPAWQQPDQLRSEDGARVQVKWARDPAVQIYPLGEGFVPPASNYVEAGQEFGGVMTLLGYAPPLDAVTPGTEIPLTLYWQVGATPMRQPAPTRGAPLSTFVHLVEREANRTVAQFDGWPTALAGLEPGDIIEQPLVLTVPDEVGEGPFEVRVGLYSPQDWARLPVMGDTETSDFVTIAVD